MILEVRDHESGENAKSRSYPRFTVVSTAGAANKTAHLNRKVLAPAGAAHFRRLLAAAVTVTDIINLINHALYLSTSVYGTQFEHLSMHFSIT